jgi:hypothetical protein
LIGPLNAWVALLELIISLGLGAVGGYYCYKYDIVGFIILGAWLGATTTILFQNIVIRAIATGLLIYRLWEPAKTIGIILGSCIFLIPILYTYVLVDVYMFWACFVVMAVVGSVIAYLLRNTLVNIGTSFLGAYLVISVLIITNVEELIGNFITLWKLYEH